MTGEPGTCFAGCVNCCALHFDEKEIRSYICTLTAAHEGEHEFIELLCSVADAGEILANGGVVLIRREVGKR